MQFQLQSGATTNYFSPCGYVSGNNNYCYLSLTNAAVFVPNVCSYSKLYLNFGSTTVGSGTSVVYTVYTNGVASGITVTQRNNIVISTSAAFTLTNGYIAIGVYTSNPLSPQYSSQWTLN